MNFIYIISIISIMGILIYFIKKKYIEPYFKEEEIKIDRSNKIDSMYIHIPFCNHICTYCDFTKFNYNEQYVKKYIESLIYQIENSKPSKCSTLYIGGGTPTSLDYKNLEKLLKFLNKYKRKKCEFSIEVNPESIDEKKIKILKKYGINRVSIGVQSFNENILKILGRKHKYEDVVNCVNLLKKHEIDNYSFDFIYGIDSQSKENWTQDLNIAINLQPTHLSLYSLSIEKHTMLYINKQKEMETDDVRDLYDIAYKTLKKNGYKRYEISNFSKKGYKSRHNLTYWNNKNYYAFGVSASSYIDNHRRKYSSNLNSYLNKEYKYEEELIDDKSYEFEYIMLKLRLDSGISLKDYESIFKKNFIEEYKDKIEKLNNEKLIKINKNSITTTYNGSMLLNYVIITLTKE